MAVAVVLLLALPVVARLSADGQPIPPRAPAPVLPPLTGGKAGTVTPLPRFSTPAARAALTGLTTVDGVHRAFVALAEPLLGANRTAALWQVVTRQTIALLRSGVDGQGALERIPDQCAGVSVPLPAAGADPQRACRRPSPRRRSIG